MLRSRPVLSRPHNVLPLLDAEFVCLPHHSNTDSTNSTKPSLTSYSASTSSNTSLTYADASHTSYSASTATNASFADTTHPCPSHPVEPAQSTEVARFRLGVLTERR